MDLTPPPIPGLGPLPDRLLELLAGLRESDRRWRPFAVGTFVVDEIVVHPNSLSTNSRQLGTLSPPHPNTGAER